VKQIHLEAYFFNDIWNHVKAFPNPNRVNWYALTPANYDFLKVIYPVPSKEELARVMGERLQWMVKQGCYPLGLHIHFWRFCDMPTNHKRKLIREALDFGDKYDVSFNRLVPGWFTYTNDLEKLCSMFGLKLVKKERSIHDYDLPLLQNITKKAKIIR